MPLPRHQHLKLTTFISGPGGTSNQTLTVFALGPVGLGNSLAHALCELECDQIGALAVAARDLSEVIDPGTEDGAESGGLVNAFVQAAVEYALWLEAREKEKQEPTPDGPPAQP